MYKFISNTYIFVSVSKKIDFSHFGSNCGSGFKIGAEKPLKTLAFQHFLYFPFEDPPSPSSCSKYRCIKALEKSDNIAVTIHFSLASNSIN
ncbi:hypothetical protein ACI2WT_18150 [Lysinibacillus fusiformis]